MAPEDNGSSMPQKIKTDYLILVNKDHKLVAEPWHLRYVGDTEIAKEITEKGITLEEYLGRVS